MTKTTSSRIKWVDMAKGIAMLLVICGHTIGYSGTGASQQLIRGIIYSFHIPLFFILSGYTSKCSGSREELFLKFKKSVKTLILPAYGLWLVILIFPGVTSKFHYLAIQIGLSGLFASAVEFTINDITVPIFGYIWFLVSLFILKNLYDLLNYILKGRFMTAVSIAVSAAGIIIGKIFFLPFTIDIAMAAMIFYHFGQLLKKRELKFSVPKLLISLLIWLGIFFFEYLTVHAYLDMASRLHSITLLSYIAAIGGSMFCIYACMYLCECRRRIPEFIAGQLLFIGRNSMILYGIHYLDTIWFTDAAISISSQYLQLLVRLLEDVCLFYVVVYLTNKFRTRKENSK